MKKVLTNLKPGTVGSRIFDKPIIKDDVSFDVKKAKEEAGEGDKKIKEMLGSSNKKKPGKYFVSQEPNWGPKARAMGGAKKKQKKDEEDDEEEK